MRQEYVNTDSLWRSIIRWRNAKGFGPISTARRLVDEKVARMVRAAVKQETGK